MLAARLVPNAKALAFDDDQRIDSFKFFVLLQMMPHMGLISLDNVGVIILGGVNVHGLHLWLFGFGRT